MIGAPVATSHRVFCPHRVLHCVLATPMSWRIFRSSARLLLVYKYYIFYMFYLLKSQIKYLCLGNRELIEAVELGGGLEFAVEMTVDDLHEEFAQVGEARGRQWLGPLLLNEAIDGVAEDEGGEGAGLEGHLRAGDAAVLLTDQAVAQGVEESGLGGERGGALDALVDRGKKGPEAEQPEIEIGDGQPDGAGFQRLEDGPGEAEDAVVGFAVDRK